MPRGCYVSSDTATETGGRVFKRSLSAYEVGRAEHVPLRRCQGGSRPCFHAPARASRPACWWCHTLHSVPDKPGSIVVAVMLSALPYEGPSRTLRISRGMKINVLHFCSNRVDPVSFTIKSFLENTLLISRCFRCTTSSCQTRSFYRNPYSCQQRAQLNRLQLN